MNIVLTQLSDIHFKSNEQNILCKRIDKIASAINSSANDVDACLILITGDIAYSGSAEEYTVAQSFFQELRLKLSEELDAIELIFIFIPGNHDCEFKPANNVRERILPTVSIDETIPPDIIGILIDVQKNYFNFTRNWNKDALAQLDSEIFKSFKIKITDGEIRINLINTAWMSKLHEIPGTLLFPESEILTVVDEVDNPSLLAITLMHHPYQWLHPDNARLLKDKVEAVSDIIFTGHEHDSARYTKISQKQHVEYIEGGVLQGDFRDICEFNVVKIDLENKEYLTNLYSWKEKDQYFEILNSEKSNFRRNSYRLRNEYIVSEGFGQKLSDPEAKFSHPDKDSISLEDIFIYPQIRHLHLPGDPEWIKTILQGHLLDFVLKNKKILFIGGDKSGKSSLAKILFRDTLKSELIPIIIPGNSFKSLEKSHITNVINSFFETIYSSPTFEKYIQLSDDKKVLIMDDYHKCPLNAPSRDLLMKELEHHFGQIILFGDDQLRFTNLMSEKTKKIVLFGIIQLVKLWNLAR